MAAAPGLTWISSNRICDNSPGSAQVVQLRGLGQPRRHQLEQAQHQGAITNAGSANPACNATAPAGTNTYLDNGMVQPTFNLLRTTFVANRTSTLPGGDIMKIVNGSPVVAYQARRGAGRSAS